MNTNHRLEINQLEQELFNLVQELATYPESQTALNLKRVRFLQERLEKLERDQKYYEHQIEKKNL